MTVYTSGYTHNSTSGYTYSDNGNSSYTVVYGPKAGTDTYKVSFTQSTTSISESGTLWIQTSGLIVAVYVNGQNLTGSAALTAAYGLTSPFPSQDEYQTAGFIQSSESFPGVTLENQTTVKLGPTTVPVTTYGIQSPTGICSIGGFVETFGVYQFQVGHLQNVLMPLVTLRSTSGSYTIDSSTLSFTSVDKITSVTAG